MLAALASLLLRMLASTWRIRVVGVPPNKPCIVAFWHGEMLPVWYVMRKKKPVALVSASKDGAYLSRLLTDWGYTVIRGSSSRGGSEALQGVVAALNNNIVLLTPDGPRGPSHQCKPGVVVSAQRSQVPLVLMRAVAPRAKVFEKSWDKFMLPTLFSHITIHVSQEIFVSPELTRDEIDKKIKDVEQQLADMLVC